MLRLFRKSLLLIILSIVMTSFQIKIGNAQNSDVRTLQSQTVDMFTFGLFRLNHLVVRKTDGFRKETGSNVSGNVFFDDRRIVISLIFPSIKPYSSVSQACGDIINEIREALGVYKGKTLAGNSFLFTHFTYPGIKQTEEWDKASTALEDITVLQCMANEKAGEQYKWIWAPLVSSKLYSGKYDD